MDAKCIVHMPTAFLFRLRESCKRKSGKLGKDGEGWKYLKVEVQLPVKSRIFHKELWTKPRTILKMVLLFLKFPKESLQFRCQKKCEIYS